MGISKVTYCALGLAIAFALPAMPAARPQTGTTRRVTSEQRIPMSGEQGAQPITRRASGGDVSLPAASARLDSLAAAAASHRERLDTLSATRAAILSAAMGGTAGTIIAHQMDLHASELMREMPGTSVERFGEGILVTFWSPRPSEPDFDRAQLRILAASLRRYPATELVIAGHSRTREWSTYVQGQTVRRANSAAQFLATQGIGSGRMRTAGSVELYAPSMSAREEARLSNHRIDVAIFTGEKARTGAANEATRADAQNEIDRQVVVLYSGIHGAKAVRMFKLTWHRLWAELLLR